MGPYRNQVFNNTGGSKTSVENPAWTHNINKGE
jgi:hypothetical protein